MQFLHRVRRWWILRKWRHHQIGRPLTREQINAITEQFVESMGIAEQRMRDINREYADLFDGGSDAKVP